MKSVVKFFTRGIHSIPFLRKYPALAFFLLCSSLLFFTLPSYACAQTERIFYYLEGTADVYSVDITNGVPGTPDPLFTAGSFPLTDIQYDEVYKRLFFVEFTGSSYNLKYVNLKDPLLTPVNLSNNEVFALDPAVNSYIVYAFATRTLGIRRVEGGGRTLSSMSIILSQMAISL